MNNTCHNRLYRLFKSIQETPDVIHNLTGSKKKIPIHLRAVLSLGLKFSIPTYPNLRKIQDFFNEGIRKFTWNIYF